MYGSHWFVVGCMAVLFVVVVFPLSLVRVSSLVCSACPMSLVWLELLELMEGRSGVALTQF
jgi:hypothetical protein